MGFSNLRISIWLVNDPTEETVSYMALIERDNGVTTASGGLYNKPAKQSAHVMTVTCTEAFHLEKAAESLKEQGLINIFDSSTSIEVDDSKDSDESTYLTDMEAERFIQQFLSKYEMPS